MKSSPLRIEELNTVKIYKLPEDKELHQILACENEDEENSAIL